jgi:hypothetical protein
MAFGALLAFIFVLGLTGRKASKGTYLAIGAAALIASMWEYLS